MRVKSFYKHYYLMLLPGLLWVFVFKIIPMFGVVMAFQRFNPGKGIFGLPGWDWRTLSICSS